MNGHMICGVKYIDTRSLKMNFKVVNISDVCQFTTLAKDSKHARKCFGSH